MKFYKCSDCGSIFTTLDAAAKVCEDSKMTEMVANTTDAATEKHVPAVSKEGNKVVVKVGSVTHPMLDAHFIQWIVLETKAGYQVKELKPGEEPSAVFLLSEDDAPVAAYEYCNLHGLWKAEI